MGLADVTQTGLEVELGGVKYHMEQLTDQDHADLDSWVQSTFISNAHAAARDLPADEYEQMMKLAMRESLGLTWMFDPGRRTLRTFAGHAQLAWRGIRHRHPDVAFETIRAAMTDARTLQYFKLMFQRVNFPEATQEAANGKPNPPEPASSSHSQQGSRSTSGSPP